MKDRIHSCSIIVSVPLFYLSFVVQESFLLEIKSDFGSNLNIPGALQ